MWHEVLIAVHAVAGVVALAAGVVAVRTGRLFHVYLVSLGAMALFLVVAIVVDWSTIDTAARAVFAALAALVGFMVWRALRARGERPDGVSRPSPRYVAHVGFTLVALVDAFAVIAVLDAGAPMWLVAGTGVLIAVAGPLALRRVTAESGQPRQRRLARR